MDNDKVLALRETILLPADVEEMAFREIMISKTEELAKVLPENRNIERFIRQVILAVERNPDLKACSNKSKFMAAVDCAEVDLDLTPAKGQAYLIPRWNKNTGLTEVCMMPGYRGFIELVTRTGKVTNVESVLVYTKDNFKMVRGTTPEIKHIPYLKEDRGDVTGCYAIAWFPNGRFQPEYMTFKEIEVIRKRAKTPKIWDSDTGEMQRKTVIRRLFKYLPISSKQLDRAIELDNEIAGMEDVPESLTLAEKMAIPMQEAGLEPKDETPVDAVIDSPAEELPGSGDSGGPNNADLDAKNEVSQDKTASEGMVLPDSGDRVNQPGLFDRESLEADRNATEERHSKGANDD